MNKEQIKTILTTYPTKRKDFALAKAVLDCGIVDKEKQKFAIEMNIKSRIAFDSLDPNNKDKYGTEAKKEFELKKELLVHDGYQAILKDIVKGKLDSEKLEAEITFIRDTLNSTIAYAYLGADS
jgi:paraquat-inducible protein B